MDLEKWLRRYARRECKELNSSLQTENTTFNDAVVSILKKHKTTRKVVDDYAMLAKKGIDEQFKSLLERI